MLVNSKKVLQDARKKKQAIFHFNINNLEWAKYLMEASKENNKTVILGFSEGAIKYMGGYVVVVNLIKALDKELKLKNKIIIHLDHGKSVESCKKAIDAGFASVMYDGSFLPLKENIKNINKITKYAGKNVSVEAEVGALSTSDGSVSYTRLEEVLEYLSKTNIDSLAISIGNQHGFYKGKPNINIELLKEINSKVNIPLVLHGSSGISKQVLSKCILNGISKININTEFQKVWSEEVKKYLKKEPNAIDPRKIIGSGESAIKEVARQYLNLR